MQRVAARFGSYSALARALRSVGYQVGASSVSQWSTRGGGLIPSIAMKKVLEAAYTTGIILTSEDLDPRETIDPASFSVEDDHGEVETVTTMPGLESTKDTAIPEMINVQVIGGEEIEKEIKDFHLDKIKDLSERD